MNESDDQSLWSEFFEIDRDYSRRIMALWSKIQKKTRVLLDALGTPHQRGTALRLLLLLDDQSKRELFPTLVKIASVSHSDIALCRVVIQSMPRAWVVENIKPFIESTLESANAPDIEEEYRRFAELLLELDKGLLKEHLDTALRHESSHVREVGQDFQKHLTD